MTPMRLAALAGTWVFTTFPLGCNDHPLKEVEYSTEQEAGDTVDVAINKDVDILFVIDNSISMSEEQATLANSFAAFISVLEREGVEANYRLAITTTDVGHAYAPSGCNAPENGKLQLSSCQQRELAFQNPGDPDDDAFDRACLEVCDHPEIEVLPTPTHVDPEPSKRNWIESIDGVTNLADGVKTADAFSCVGPQGITGCGFEAPLESMYRSLREVTTQTSPSFGFVRPGAILAVVIVTDEVDCSARLSSEYAEVWDGAVDAPKTFWGEPNLPNQYPFSDVCFFAGTKCSTAEDGTTECVGYDYAVDGGQGNPDSSVMFPVSRYTDLLDEIELDKKRIYENQEVLVAVIAGVPSGYSEGREEVRYSLESAAEADFVERHGVAPGCQAEGIGKAAPPVRLLEFAEHFTEDRSNVFSVCNDDYSEALEAIADQIADQIQPACVTSCVADSDALTAGLQPNCTVEETVLDVISGESTEQPIKACSTTAGGFDFPEGEGVCYRYLVADERSMECVEDGWNLELSIERKDGERAASGTSISATCSSSQNVDLDCPDLKG